jgi:hypothetical protein
MTQKIMAKVRSESGGKSWFQRWFFPLHIKLPLEAIGVLFITVTAVFIYQNMQPAMKALNPLSEEHGPAVIAKNEETKPAELARRLKSMPQSPEYKALDMKQEYEKPAPPMLQEDQAAAPAPSPSKPAEQPAASASAEKRTAYDAAARNDQAFSKKEAAPARGMMQERFTASGAAPESMAKAKQAAPAAAIAGGAVATGKTNPAIIVQVMDVEAAAKDVEKAVTHVHGSIVRRESTGSKTIFVVAIKASQVREFKNKLKFLGELKEQPVEGALQKEQVELRVELFRK